MITFERSPISRITCMKSETYHASSFLYVDGAFKMQHGEKGGSPEIVSRKLDKWEAKMKDWTPPKVEKHLEEDNDKLPF